MNVNTAGTAPLMRQTQNTSLTGPAMQSHQILLLLFVLLLSHYEYCKEIQLSFFKKQAFFYRLMRKSAWYSLGPLYN